tara:strand:+ start:214 stop:447 length:234 start_codon:yes stop_codon:yes gene_type:complete
MGNVISMSDFKKKEEEEQLDGIALGATEMEQLEYVVEVIVTLLETGETTLHDLVQAYVTLADVVSPLVDLMMENDDD